MNERGMVRLARSRVEWELGELRCGRRTVRVRVSFPGLTRATRIEGTWGVDSVLAAALLARGLWPECVVEMAKDVARAAVRRVT